MTHDDAEDLFFLRSNNEVMRYIDRPIAKSISDVSAYIDGIDSQINKNQAINWGITIRGDNRLIGTICLWQFELENFRCEVGYLLHPGFYRKRIMTEATKAVIKYGFTTLKFHSVTANVNPQNEASKMLLKSLGFELEAYFRENYYYNGKFLDTEIYCLLNR
jgi:ribosomal-protein-alanine N-acetyltransferase